MTPYKFDIGEYVRVFDDNNGPPGIICARSKNQGPDGAFYLYDMLYLDNAGVYRVIQDLHEDVFCAAD